MPFLGICLGMQCAVIEFARNVCGLKGANSTEFDPKTPHPVISLLEEQEGISAKGGTMRLGASLCRLAKGTTAFEAYEREEVRERHRHRYEVNNAYRQRFTRAGLVVAATHEPARPGPDGGGRAGGDLVEIIELKNHPWFVAGQFHPEFRSRPLEPHPLFRGFVEATLKSRVKGQGSRVKGKPSKSEGRSATSKIKSKA